MTMIGVEGNSWHYSNILECKRGLCCTGLCTYQNSTYEYLSLCTSYHKMQVLFFTNSMNTEL